MQVNEKYSIYVRGGTFKRGDTMRHIVISFQDEQGCWVTPNPDHTFVAKVANPTGYIGDYPVTVIDSDFIISTKVFAKLPDDKYELEIWEIWPSDGNEEPDKTIYPTPETVVPFTIEANVTDKSGEIIKKIGFQDVVDQAVMNIGMNYIFKVNTIEPDQTATVVQTAADGKNYVTFNIPRGAKGDKGDQGVQGIRGVKGDPGARGPQGIQGEKGEKGDQGPQGLQGVQGPQGETGDVGPRGPQGPAGKNFNIKKTFSSIQEMNNSKGAGFEDGDFTVIASTVDDPDNSKMYVWDGSKFTYISDLSGAQGIQGPVGPKGDTGAQGPQGLTGPQGVQGVQGVQGKTGATGATGPVGPKGDKGDVGPQGIQGERGPQGPQGPQGPAGQNANDTTHILQSGDFNNIRTNGYYETNGTFANSPLPGNWGELSVITGEHYTRQVWTKGDSGEMFIRSSKYNSDNWAPWYKIGIYETSPYWQDSTVSYAHGMVVNGICDLRVKVRITSSSWHDLIHGLPEAAENFTFWWNSENAKIGRFSMNGNALSCRADQVDDYDVHMTYAIKM